MLDVPTLLRARQLGRLNEEKTRAHFSNHLATLGAQLHVRRAYNQGRDRYYRLSRPQAAQLRAIFVVDARITDFHVRIGMIERLWKQALSTELDLEFYNFGCLLIRDIHVDVLSAMDAAARVAILTNAPIMSGDQPTIGALLVGSSSPYRTQLPDDVRQLMDASARWIKPIGTIRNILTHREHEKLIFGHPSERRQFQVYETGFAPKILEPFLMVHGSKIVDLDRYLTFLWAEMNVFMDSLGMLVAKNLGETVTLSSSRETAATFLVTDLDLLIGSS